MNCSSKIHNQVGLSATPMSGFAHWEISISFEEDFFRERAMQEVFLTSMHSRISQIAALTVPERSK